MVGSAPGMSVRRSRGAASGCARGWRVFPVVGGVEAGAAVARGEGLHDAFDALLVVGQRASASVVIGGWSSKDEPSRRKVRLSRRLGRVAWSDGSGGEPRSDGA